MENNIKLLYSIDQKYTPDREFPDSFQYEKEMKKVHELIENIKPIINKNFTIDNNVQDAYFFTEITSISNNTSIKEDKKELNIKLRFSNFGNMIAAEIYNENMSSDIPEYIKNKIESQGWRVLSTNWLFNNKYDGVHEYFIDKKYEWWYRFFDYC